MLMSTGPRKSPIINNQNMWKKMAVRVNAKFKLMVHSFPENIQLDGDSTVQVG